MQVETEKDTVYQPRKYTINDKNIKITKQNIINRKHRTKMKFSIRDFFSKCAQIRRNLQTWSHLLKKSLMENFIFCAVKIIGHWIQRYFKIAHYDKKCKKSRFIGVICQAV